MMELKIEKMINCHYCNKDFWVKFNNNKCPRCGHVTKPFHNLVNWAIILGSMLAIIATVMGVSR